MSRTFRNYEICEQIGRGGMASVYRGRHLTLGSPVAIKILHPALAYDTTFLARFELEAKIAANIQNHNIVKVIDFGSEDGVYFIVMEYIEGRDLAQLFACIRKSAGAATALPPEICFLLLEGVAHGLKAAHEKGILHRDIKPGNILLDHHGLVRVADFGLARDSSGSQRADLTLTGSILGTPSYMSPEQAVGEKLDVRTDVFSLGVMAYQWFSGEMPFRGETHSEVLENIIEQDSPLLDSKKMPWITEETRYFIEKALQKTPEHRFQSMNEILVSLRLAYESMDPTGRAISNQREYLGRFAKDPVAASIFLRQVSVKAHLRRGLRFMDMGQGKLREAMSEFQFVLNLEPHNTRAKKAIHKLEQKWRKISGSNDTDFESQAFASETNDTISMVIPARKKTVKRRYVWALGLLLLLVVVGAFFGSQLIPGLKGLLMESFVVVVEPPVEAQPLSPVSTVPVIQELLKDQVRDVVPEVVPDSGKILFSTREPCRLELNGAVVYEGEGDTDLSLSAGVYGLAILYFPEIFGRLNVGPLVVEPGKIMRLGRQELETGHFRITASHSVSLVIDDRTEFADVRELSSRPIAAGAHVFFVERSGFVVDAVKSNGRLLREVSVRGGKIGYELIVEGGHDYRVLFRMRAKK